MHEIILLIKTGFRGTDLGQLLFWALETIREQNKFLILMELTRTEKVDKNK